MSFQGPWKPQEHEGRGPPRAHPHSLHLWLGTAQLVVVYIVPVFKNILSSVYTPPSSPTQAWGIHSMTLRIRNSRTTQGTGLRDLRGLVVDICLPVLCGERVAAIP